MNQVPNVYEEIVSSSNYQKTLETGRTSGLIAIRVKPGGDKSRLPATIMFEAENGDTYFLFGHPGNYYPDTVKVRSAKEFLPGIDVIGENDSIILPSPIDERSWINIDCAQVPEDILPLILEDPHYVLTEVPEGVETPQEQRVNSAIRYMSELMDGVEDGPSIAALWPKFQTWNTANSKKWPPYNEKDLRGFFDFLTGHEYRKYRDQQLSLSVEEPRETDTPTGKAPSHAVRLVDMVLKNPKVTLFKDEYEAAYVRIPIGDHSEVWPCKSSAFKRWLSGEFYRLTKGQTVIGQESTRDAIGLFEGRAINESTGHKLYNRFGQTPDTIWYDLADPQWRAIKITKDGWNVVTDVPPLFRRFSHLDPQVEPVRGGTVDEVLKFVNVTNPDQQILFLVHLVASFIPGWPHPALYVYGTQGSAKSTLSRIERKLIDPSKTEVVSMTRKENDLAQQLAHHSFLFFDNVSDIPDWIADLLCRAITGSGFSKKELYTTDEDFISYVMTNIGINGINLASNRADLLERCLLLKLERMKDRKEEHQLMADFELARPKILGAIFDTVAKAMTLRPSIQVDKLPRMADFTLWGCAIAEVLGIGQKAFLSAYRRNISNQSEELINDSTVATLVKKIVDTHGGRWESSPTELFTAFKNQAEAEKIVGGRLPASPAALTREINRLKTPFEETGYQIEFSHDRTVTIRKVNTEG